MNLLVTGGSGVLGRELLKHFPSALAPTRKQLDVRDDWLHSSFLSAHAQAVQQADTVVHLAGLVNQACERRGRRAAMAVNVKGVLRAAEFCIQNGKRLVYASTSYVFRGDRGPYAPDDETGPVNYYGETKLAGEIVTKSVPRWCIARLAFMPDPFPFDAAYVDVYASLLPLPVAAEQLAELIASGDVGLFHLCGPRRSIYEYAESRRASHVQPVACRDGVPRPVDSSMRHSR